MLTTSFLTRTRGTRLSDLYAKGQGNYDLADPLSFLLCNKHESNPSRAQDVCTEWFVLVGVRLCLVPIISLGR